MALCRWNRLVIATAFLLALAWLTARPLDAEELLDNGGFEAGKSQWSGNGAFTSGCPAHSGAAGLRLAAGPGDTASVRQSVPVQAGAGPYEFSGYIRLQAGDAGATAEIRWLDGQGNTIGEVSQPLSLEDSYDGFSVDGDAPDGAASARVQVSIEAGAVAAEVCLDDLAFEEPDVLQPTHTPTPTETPLPTATPTPTQTPILAPTQPPIANPQAPGGSPPAAPASGGGASAATSGGVAAFTNGGFEAGLAGWRKYGGDLSLVGSPVHGGSGAGALTSATTSTKWAFQFVPVDQAQAYEFSGYLATAGAVTEAYLRISFYASADGSGSAIATADSTARITGANGVYTYLTTGPVTPPTGALTARPRVLLSPIDAAAATVYLDDLAFGVATAAAASPTPLPSAAAPAAAPAGGNRPAPTAVPAGLAPVPLGSPVASATPTPFNTLNAQITIGPAAGGQPLPSQLAALPEDEGSPITPALAGLGMLVLAVSGAGAYLIGQRSTRT